MVTLLTLPSVIIFHHLHANQVKQTIYETTIGYIVINSITNTIHGGIRIMCNFEAFHSNRKSDGLDISFTWQFPADVYVVSAIKATQLLRMV
jgi:hypothetical protein